MSIFTKKEEGYSETIKWRQANTSYEIHTTILDSLDLLDLVPHCMSIRTKVDNTVSTVAHKGPSFYRVFPRTLSLTMRSVWDQLMADSDADPDVDNNETPANFDARLRDFIAAHATAEDRYDLVQELRNGVKPREVLVQQFWYKKREWNGYVNWYPGNEPALNDRQIKQAIFEGMPPTWKERFNKAGKSLTGSTTAQVVQYFRQQENEAKRKQEENTLKQRREASSRRTMNPKGTSAKRSIPANDRKSSGTTKQSKSTGQPTKRGRISDDTPCPIHVGAGHTWGKCYLNASNQDRPNRDNKKPRRDNTDANAVTVNDNAAEVVSLITENNCSTVEAVTAINDLV